MSIPEKQKQTLEKTDEELFLCGACHVFADELCTEFVARGYQFCAVYVKDGRVTPMLTTHCLIKIVYYTSWLGVMILSLISKASNDAQSV